MTSTIRRTLNQAVFEILGECQVSWQNRGYMYGEVLGTGIMAH